MTSRPNLSPPYSMFTSVGSTIAFVVALAIGLAVACSPYTPPAPGDYQQPAEEGINGYYGPRVWTDSETGCEYLKYNTLTPRLERTPSGDRIRGCRILTTY